MSTKQLSSKKQPASRESMSGELSEAEIRDVLFQAMSDPVCVFLTEFSAAQDPFEQQQVLREHRAWLATLPPDQRKFIYAQINDMINEMDEADQ